MRLSISRELRCWFFVVLLLFFFNYLWFYSVTAVTRTESKSSSFIQWWLCDLPSASLGNKVSRNLISWHIPSWFAMWTYLWCWQQKSVFASLVQIQASLAGISKHSLGEKVHLCKCIHSNPKWPSTWTLKIHPCCFHPSLQEEAFFAVLKFSCIWRLIPTTWSCFWTARRVLQLLLRKI